MLTPRNELFSQIQIKYTSVFRPLNSHTPETDQRSINRNQWFLISKPSKNNSYLSVVVQQFRHIKNINLTISANTMTVWGKENTFINTEYTDSVFSQTFFFPKQCTVHSLQLETIPPEHPEVKCQAKWDGNDLNNSPAPSSPWEWSHIRWWSLTITLSDANS